MVLWKKAGNQQVLWESNVKSSLHLSVQATSAVALKVQVAASL